MSTDIAEGYVEETWTCMGRRLDVKGKLFYKWLNAAGEEAHYDKLKGQPGRRYGVQRKVDGTSVLIQPRWLNERADEADVAKWEAQDRADAAELERNRLEAKDAKDSELHNLVFPLRELYKRQVGPGRRAAFLAIVIEMMTR
jgi:hypothetical protein